ncbi:efflux RND transporter periplasmic adaptor subunit [Sphingomonas daechungensis]|uniref:efflux RND transporter periplasmic adaptor subunit n=1 Tax=Sphingomonas daechungensis TaxID=1176646 RepID=UPI003783DAD5
MTIKEQSLQIIRLSDSRSRMIAGAAALALATGAAGLLIGWASAPPAAVQTSTEPAEAEESHGPEGFVPMTAERMSASGIVVEQVRAGSVENEIIAQATVTAPPEGQALVTARADGAIIRISKRLGDPVVAGETLAVLESRDAAQFVAERNAAAARERAAHASWQREERLFRERITAREALESARSTHDAAEVELRRAETALKAAGVIGDRNLAVRSPIAGRITEVDTQLGAYVTAGAELFNVANPNRTQVDAAVPAADAQRIVPGDRAVVELPTGGLLDALVRSSTPSVNLQSRAATVVLQFTGSSGGLRQGQGVRVRITPFGTKTDVIVLPEGAVQQVEGRDAVFVQVKGGFQATPVSVGSRGNGRVEILDGVRAGQVVVTEGAFALKSQLGASEAEH